MTPMVIALDWDGTVTMDVDAWVDVVRELHLNGHSVYIVTMRYPSERDPDMERFLHLVKAVVFTCREAKKPAMEGLGVTVNVWIEDNPRAVLEDAVTIWGRATPEGQVVVNNQGALEAAWKPYGGAQAELMARGPAQTENRPDRDKSKMGVYHKFNVQRTDGSDGPGGKHDGCDYFVLDVTYDPFAKPALQAYAQACSPKYPLLALDMRKRYGLSAVVPPLSWAEAERISNLSTVDEAIRALVDDSTADNATGLIMAVLGAGRQ